MADPQDHPSEDRLKAFEERLARAKDKPEEVSLMKKDFAQANVAWQMVIELVSGLAIGFGMGYGLDKLFGTLPIFLLIFTLLGLAAGIKTMLSTARQMETKLAAGTAKDENEDATHGD